LFALLLSLSTHREEHISRKIEGMVTEAKAKLAKGDKKGALFAMKRKKLYEAEVDKIQNVKMTLETQVINLESAAQNHETFQALKAGGSTLKEMRTQVDIGNVDDIMDELKEEMEIAQEINQAIAQPLDPLMTDDDELLAELNALEVSDLEAELLAPPTQSAGFSLPTVPNSKMPSLEESEAEDLRALEAELGM
jgi:charged multivesicular body protein 4